jgi:hypothetical protein
MRIRTPTDLGALIRDRRTTLGLDQKSLAPRSESARSGSSKSKRANRGLKSASSCVPSPTLESSWRRTVPEKQKSGKDRTLSILIPSSLPRARKENEHRTHRHP